MLKSALTCSVFLTALSSVCLGISQAQTSGESSQICEAAPVMKCLDKEMLEGTTLTIPLHDAGIAQNGLSICDSSFNYTTSPDIVLIMDNTGSMDSVGVLAGIPRWCPYPDKQVGDIGCISGDPRRQRGPALQAFIDSAVVKGGVGMKVGVVTFSDVADAKSTALLPLNASTKEAIKSSITMKENGETNYTAAFRAAMNLLQSSKKPVGEQFIIFVSDGRPNFPKHPDGDPYMYKEFWDSLPTVHSIFLGENSDNYKDMQDISRHTGGDFYNIPDVGLLAGILTDNLAKKLFRRALPTLTTVRNLTASVVFQVDATKHELLADSTVYTLHLPGPVYLKPGVNDIVIKTEYGYGGNSQDIHFKINRADAGPYSAIIEACRDYPQLVLYNSRDQAVNLVGLPFTINDSLLRYSLTTAAVGLDSFPVAIRTQSAVTSQQDLEAVMNTASNRTDSTWTGSAPFEHQTVQKKPGDRIIQADHGETIVVSYRNPFIPEDSVQARVKVKYGPEFDQAAYWDLDGDGRIETVDIRFKEALGNLPQKLSFHIVDAAGKVNDREANASKDEIAFGEKSDHSADRGHIIVTLANPFPYGVSSIAYPDTSGRAFRQLDIPMVDGAFRVDDSLPPVVLEAAVAPADKSHPLVRVMVTYSEPVTLDILTALEPIVLKRDTVVFTSKQMPLDHIEKISETEYVFHLSTDAVFTPVGGDSIAINNNGETRDLQARAPTSRTFAPMGGPVPRQRISDFYVTFANGSKSRPEASSQSPDADRILIPVDGSGYPLPGNENGKCGGCTSMNGKLFAGSVIVLVTKQPVTYEFSIFTNLGELVARAGGKVEEADLPLLDKKEDPSHDPNLTEYTQRIIWTGRTSNGQNAGTGGYVLKAMFRYERSFKTGAHPSVSTKFTKFGFLRECCATFNTRWYDWN